MDTTMFLQAIIGVLKYDSKFKDIRLYNKGYILSGTF